MKITTSEELASVDCCGCLRAECYSPRKECRSIRIVPCGYKNYWHTELGKSPSTELEWCGSWENIDRVYNIDYPSSTSDLGGNDYTTASYEHYHSVHSVDNSWPGCALVTELITHDNYSYVYEIENGPTYEILRDQTQNCNSIYTPEDGCIGTHTSVSPSGVDPVFSVPWNNCDFYDLRGDFYTALVGADSVTFTKEYDGGYYTITTIVTYSGRVTFETLTARLDALNFDDHANGYVCSPSIEGHDTCIGTPGSITKTGYRIGVPYAAADMPRSVFEAQWDIYSFPHGWLDWKWYVDAYVAAVAAHAAWVIEHAAWVVAQAAYVVAQAAYVVALDEWIAISDAAWADYLFWHEIWEFYPEDFPEGEPQPPGEDDLPPEPIAPTSPGPEPEEPVIPDDPGEWAGSPFNTCDDTDGPLFVASEEWIWGGDMGPPNADPIVFAANPEQWSPWFTMPMPELPTPLSDAWEEDGNFKSDCINRDIRIMNMMTKCYRSTSLGVAPTVHPPIYVPPEV